MDARAPIGVFDSGVGGLSTLHEIRLTLPNEDLLYVADSGFAPYGDRPPDYVLDRANRIVDFLVTKGVKAVVVACNTATSIAVDVLRSTHSFPIVAIEPAIKPAAKLTRTGTIGVMATSQTLAGARFARLVATFARDVKVLTQACPGLVERVEAGDLVGPETRTLVERYVRPLVDGGADTVVLGCTHYPFVRALVQESAGAEVTVVDSARPVARQLARRLTEEMLRSTVDRPGAERFWTTGRVDHVQRVVASLWPAPAHVYEIPATAADPDPQVA